MSVGALVTWPYKAGGRSRRGSPKAATTVVPILFSTLHPDVVHGHRIPSGQAIVINCPSSDLCSLNLSFLILGAMNYYISSIFNKAFVFHNVTVCFSRLPWRHRSHRRRHRTPNILAKTSKTIALHNDQTRGTFDSSRQE